MRVVIADDSLLLREGLARLLAEAGVEVCGTAADATELLELVASQQPDVAIIDIRMPPTWTDEGAAAAGVLRERWPKLAILLLSQSVESRHAARLARAHPERFGYLLKDRVVDVATLTDALTRLVAGGTVLDPEVVRHLLGGTAMQDRLTSLTEREAEVLELMAQGRSNGAICRELHLSAKTVESHSSSIFTKLDLIPQPDDHRRVLAVLLWLSAS